MKCRNEAQKEYFKSEKNPFYEKHHTEETKDKIRNSKYHRNLKGKKNPRYGIPLAEAAKEKISEANKGKHLSPATEFKKGNIPWGKGKPGLQGKDNPMYGTHRTGQDNPFYGRQHTEETKEILRELGKKLVGKKNPHWKGGYEPYYGPNWNEQRRRALERDDHICQKCGMTEDGNGRSLSVHHIIPFREFGIERYEGANRLGNLASLCQHCHNG